MKNQAGNNSAQSRLESSSYKQLRLNNGLSSFCIHHDGVNLPQPLITCSPIVNLLRRNISEVKDARDFYSNFYSPNVEMEWLSKKSRHLSLKTSLSPGTVRELSFLGYYSSSFYRHAKEFPLFPHKAADTIVYIYNSAYNYLFTKILKLKEE